MSHVRSSLKLLKQHALSLRSAHTSHKRVPSPCSKSLGSQITPFLCHRPVWEWTKRVIGDGKGKKGSGGERQLEPLEQIERMGKWKNVFPMTPDQLPITCLHNLLTWILRAKGVKRWCSIGVIETVWGFESLWSVSELRDIFPIKDPFSFTLNLEFGTLNRLLPWNLELGTVLKKARQWIQHSHASGPSHGVNRGIPMKHCCTRIICLHFKKDKPLTKAGILPQLFNL